MHADDSQSSNMDVMGCSHLNIDGLNEKIILWFAYILVGKIELLSHCKSIELFTIYPLGKNS